MCNVCDTKSSVNRLVTKISGAAHWALMVSYMRFKVVILGSGIKTASTLAISEQPSSVVLQPIHMTDVVQGVRSTGD